MCMELNLDQLIDEPTRNSNILDIILTSDPQLVLNYSIEPPLGASDHNSVVASLNSSIFCKTKNVNIKPATKIVWDPNNVTGALNYLHLVDWNAVICPNLHREQMWLSFKNTLLTVVDHFSKKIQHRHIQACVTMNPKTQNEIKRFSSKKLSIWKQLRNVINPKTAILESYKNYKVISLLISSKTYHNNWILNPKSLKEMTSANFINMQITQFLLHRG